MNPRVDWHSFLTRWARERPPTETVRVPTGRLSGALVPATDEAIQELENRLGLELPPSYVAFLRTTDGWGPVKFSIEWLRSADQVDWFHVENEEFVDMWVDVGFEEIDSGYFDYSAGYADDFFGEHLRTAVQIADYGDGYLLMIPEAVTPDGEWEVWFMASWIPGAWRFPSFAHWMVHEYAQFVEEQKIPNANVPPMPIFSPDTLRTSARRLSEPRARRYTTEELLIHLESTNELIQSKATRILYGRLEGRPLGRRRPDLVAPLCDLFNRSTAPMVRAICIEMLTEFAVDSAPAPLFEALSDPDPSVVAAGISALSWFPDPRAWQPLCQYLDSDTFPGLHQNVMHQLERLGDERAIPSLQRVLFKSDQKYEMIFSIAAIALAGLGTGGFEVLAVARTHSDSRIRFAAAVGLDVSGDPRSSPLLDEMEHDPDPRIRDRAKVRRGKIG